MLVRFDRYRDPETHEPLSLEGTTLRNAVSGRIVAEIANGIPRFVHPRDHYAESFGWQWNHWQSLRSESRGGSLRLKDTISDRFHFDQFDFEGKTILECGMGGGDDTEVLCDYPFSEIHSFDLSRAVDRAAKYIVDERVQISQASILEIPYPDQEFDYVYCHRVLQHTPDPQESLKSVCKKVKVGGVLFVHAYKKSPRYMSEWRYKYRWLTKRLPHWLVYRYVEVFGPLLHRLNEKFYSGSPIARRLAHGFIPFYRKEPADMSLENLVELEKLITFDALTPAHDHPMSSDAFFGTIEAGGFEILYKHDPEYSPLLCVARRITS